MFRSLNSRLLLSYVVVILVCLALVGLGLFLFTLTSPLWTRAAALELEETARTILADLRQEGPLETLPREQLFALLAQGAEEQNVRLLLLDGGGTIRFDSDGAWTGQQLEEVTRVPSAQGIVRGTFVAPTGVRRWAFFGQIAAAPSGGRQVVLFASRLRMLAWFADNLLPPVVQAGVVALLLSILLALWIRRSIAAPLRRVAAAAEAIATGESDTRAPLSGPTEVQALARSFNAMADQVESTQRSQRDFVANVSHDLKTPLTSIQGFSQALLDGAASTPEAIGHAAQIIYEEAERMRRLVEELLFLARFDAGQMTMARELLELGPLLRNCVEKLTPQAQAAHVTLALDIVEPLSITGDGDRLAQVLTNLLDNAMVHTPAGGKVTLAAHRVEGEQIVEITVTDTGQGIPVDDLARVFERFYQVDKARQSERGAGLGLAIAREIVEAHAGTIAVESVVGLGTRFSVRLPG